MDRTRTTKEVISARIVDQTGIAPGFHLLKLDVPDRFLNALPGQFVMVRMGGCESFFLPRPISIHSIYRIKRRTICELLYQVVGKGTFALSRLKKGDRLIVQGPLGRGFQLPAPGRKAVLVAGGMGVAPIRYLAERIQETGKKVDRETGAETSPGEIICYQGARNGSLLLELEELRKACTAVHLSTDDGSRGYRGFVTELFARDLPSFDANSTTIYACGPREMLRSLHRKIQGTGIKCQVSIEERMACGVGACLGCSVKDALGGYRCVCKDGPVFEAQELAWDAWD